MKKILMVLALLGILFGAVGCSKKTYNAKDVQIYDMIRELEDFKEEELNDGVDFDYSLTESMKGEYTLVLQFVFDEHNLELQIKGEDFEDLKNKIENSDENNYEAWTFKVDGAEYDMDTASVLANHYYDVMVVE